MAARVFKETRRLNVANHTFQPSDLRRIAEILDEESRRAVPELEKRHPLWLDYVEELKEEIAVEKAEGDPSEDRIQELEREIEGAQRRARERAEELCRAEWTIECSDESSFQTVDPSTFTDDTLPCREIQSIQVRFHPFDLDKWVSMDLYFSGRVSVLFNRLEVSGRDSNWVNGLVAKIGQIVAAAENNRHLLHGKRGWWLVCLGAILAGSTFALMRLVVGPLLAWLDKDLAGSELFLLELVPALVAGCILSWPLRDYVLWLFPPVELKLRRPTRIERHRRYLYFIATLVALPILVNLLSSLATR